MIKREMMLEGLGCASCAAKIETAVNKLNGVDSASVDFISHKLTVATDAAVDLPDLSKKITAIVNMIEPDVNIIFPAENYASESEHGSLQSEAAPATEEAIETNQPKIIRLALGAAFFIVGLILPLPPLLELAAFLISYIIVGGNVIVRAVKGIAKGQVFSEHFLMSLATTGAFIIGEYAEAAAVMLFYLSFYSLRIFVFRARIEFRTAITVTPTSANTASHISATPRAPRTRNTALIPKAIIMF